MAAITIRNLDADVVTAIKRRAADNGISMEEEIKRLIAFTYSENRQKRGREWGKRQLERLKEGQLPLARVRSVAEIRAMRRERMKRLAGAATARNEHRR